MKKNEIIGILSFVILNLIFLLISDFAPKFIYPFFMLAALYIGIYTRHTQETEL